MRLDDIMDLDVHTVPVTCTLKHLFETFINERLRQLIVVDQENNVVGIVTRKDLAGLCSRSVHFNAKESFTSNMRLTSLLTATASPLGGRKRRRCLSSRLRTGSTQA